MAAKAALFSQLLVLSPQKGMSNLRRGDLCSILKMGMYRQQDFSSSEGSRERMLRQNVANNPPTIILTNLERD